MITIIAGGKPSKNWLLAGIQEYEKRLRKPFDIKWQFLDEDKLNHFLAEWPFSGRDYVVLLDERGVNITSPELSAKLQRAFTSSRDIKIIIGGAFGVAEEVRNRADFVWSFSKLVFPHELIRLILVEQIYRASDIANGGKYHHV